MRKARQLKDCLANRSIDILASVAAAEIVPPRRLAPADQRVPLIDRELAGDDGGAAAVAVLKDLQEVVAGRGVERLEAPVVEDEEIGATERAQEAGVAAVVARQSQIAEQPVGRAGRAPSDCRGRPCCRAPRRANSCQRRRARRSAGWRGRRSIGLRPASSGGCGRGHAGRDSRCPRHRPPGAAWRIAAASTAACRVAMTLRVRAAAIFNSPVCGR